MPIIHCDDRFEKCLETLRRAGGEASIAARRAETLIRALARDDDAGNLEKRKRTRNGEARIENCRKYHLGSGYRLICVNLGNLLFPLHVGTHDECDRWIENNRKLKVDFADVSLPSMEKSPLGTDTRQEKTESADDYDALIIEQLTQRELREIFRGLYER